ncbi:Uncharacterised protein [Mycobacteroides abscessus subsp. abscessus]|nr:Uncharacterised protein [Mycobacteroides abscessus subsp. abscessus]
MTVPPTCVVGALPVVIISESAIPACCAVRSGAARLVPSPATMTTGAANRVTASIAATALHNMSIQPDAPPRRTRQAPKAPPMTRSMPSTGPPQRLAPNGARRLLRSVCSIADTGPAIHPTQVSPMVQSSSQAAIPMKAV